MMAGQVCYAGSIHKETSPVHAVDSSGFEAVLVVCSRIFDNLLAVDSSVFDVSQITE